MWKVNAPFLSHSFQRILYASRNCPYSSPQTCAVFHTQRKLYCTFQAAIWCSLLIYLRHFSVSGHIDLSSSFLVPWSISLRECSIIYLTSPLWTDVYYVFITCLQLPCYYKDTAANTPYATSSGYMWELLWMLGHVFSPSRDNSSTNTHENFWRLKEIFMRKSFANYWVRNSFWALV